MNVQLLQKLKIIEADSSTKFLQRCLSHIPVAIMEVLYGKFTHTKSPILRLSMRERAGVG